jgi:hypothetical protein
MYTSSVRLQPCQQMQANAVIPTSSCAYSTDLLLSVRTVSLTLRIAYRVARTVVPEHEPQEVANLLYACWAIDAHRPSAAARHAWHGKWKPGRSALAAVECMQQLHELC